MFVFNIYGYTQNEVLIHFQFQETYSEGLKDISKATSICIPEVLVGFQLF